MTIGVGNHSRTEFLSLSQSDGSSTTQYKGTHHDTASNDAVWSRQRDLSIRDVDGGSARPVCHDVSEVSCVSLCVRRSSVLLPRRVEVRPCAHAASGVVAKLVDVEPVVPRL